MASHGIWLWPSFRNLRFRIVGLLILSVPTLCLKDPLMGYDTIYTELLTVSVVRWNKFPECCQLKDKKNFPLTINNYLLKRNGVAIIYTICIFKEIVSLSVVFERQTNRISGDWSFSILLNFSESEALTREVLVHEEIFLLSCLR